MNWKRPFFICIFGLALALRLYHITQAPLDFHPARQYRGAEIARGYYMPGNERYPEWEQKLAAINQFQDGVLEPPILEFVTAQAFKLMGGEELWVPRVMSILFWLAAAGLLYVLAARLVTREAAMVSLVFFLFVPYGIVASRSFQPEPLMVLLLVAALLLIHQFFENPDRGKLLMAAAVSAAALFIKPTCVFILLAVFGVVLLQRRGLKNALADSALYIFAAITLLPSAAYYSWGFLFSPKLQTQAGSSFIPALFLYAGYWGGWLRNIGRTVGIFPFVIALYGLRYFPRGVPRAFVGAAFIGYLIYGLAFNYHIHTHDYYSLQLIPVVALALGPIGLAAAQWVTRHWQLPAWRLGASIGFILVVVAALGLARVGVKSASPSCKETIKNSNLLIGLSEKVFMFINPSYYHFDQQLADQRAIGELTHHSLRTIYLDSDFISIVYNAEISGKEWISSGALGVEKVRNLPVISAEERFNRDFKAKSPEYFIVSDFGEYVAQPDLAQFLQSHFPLVASKDRRYLIYRLAGSTPP